MKMPKEVVVIERERERKKETDRQRERERERDKYEVVVVRRGDKLSPGHVTSDADPLQFAMRCDKNNSTNTTEQTALFNHTAGGYMHVGLAPGTGSALSAIIALPD